MGAVALGAGIAGAGAGVIGGISARHAASQNAAMQRDAARDAKLRGAEAVRRLNEQTAHLLGSQRSSFAAQGVSLDSDVVDQVQSDTVRISELDAEQLRNNAAREAWGLNQQAEITSDSGRRAARAGLFRGTGSLLMGGYQAYDAGLFG